MKTFYCSSCGFVVFFENVSCGNCGATLGFVPEQMAMAAFAPAGDGRWRRLDDAGIGAAAADTATVTITVTDTDTATTTDTAADPATSTAATVTGGAGATTMDTVTVTTVGAGPVGWRQCHNYAAEQVCNWMVAPGDKDERCRCCRRTEHTAALDDAANKAAWFRLEAAKRQLFYSLYRLGLPVEADATHPAPVFRFLGGEHQPTTTGHLDGTITLDLGEADDACREKRRVALGEPYRTLLGHFRHEIGHYYWDRLIRHGGRLEAFRALFGDDSRDYAAAAAAYYAAPPADWADRHISAYAAMHPWEDWAETWAHYLHISDALDTAAHWGFALHADQSSDEDGAGPADVPGVAVEDQPFRQVLLEQWLPLSQFLNSMGRSLGQGDAYPFVIANPVLDKLCFVHQVVEEAARARGNGDAA